MRSALVLFLALLTLTVTASDQYATVASAQLSLPVTTGTWIAGCRNPSV
jgi:hypothetical protein